MSSDSLTVPSGARLRPWRREVSTTTPGSTSQSTTSSIPTSIATDTSSQPQRPSPTPIGPLPTGTGTYHMESGLTVGQTVGITIGAVAGACLLMGLFFLFCWRRKSKRLIQQKSLTSSPMIEQRTNHRPGGPIDNVHGPVPHPSPKPGHQRRHGLWPWSVRPDEIGVAVSSTERHGFLTKMRNPTSRSRLTLPISAPIPIDQLSIRGSFRDRFFRAPAPTPPGARARKHASDATTIRSSCHPPTPSRAPISLLRMGSQTTSIATSFEDADRDQPPEVPPLPSFLTNNLLQRPGSDKSLSEKSSPTSLEDGIRRNLRKARSHIPITSRNNKRKINVVPQKSARPLVQTRAEAGGILDPSRQHLATNLTVNYPGVDDLEKPVLPPSIPHSPQSPFLIPDRQSSLDKTRSQGDDEWLLSDNPKSNGASRKSHPLRPRPLSFKRRRRRASITSSTRDVECPQLHIPASGDQVSLHDAVMRPLLGSPWYSHAVSAEDVEAPLNRSSQQIVDRTNPLEGPSTAHQPQRQVRLASQSRLPGVGPSERPSHASPSRSSPKATITPNRTREGDLVLWVEM